MAQDRKGPGAWSLWIQRKLNARTVARIRRKGGKHLGMDLLILQTVGRRTGEPRETPVTWFSDGEDTWLLVASGGGKRNPDWYANLMAHPDRAAIELPGRGRIPVTPRLLEGEDRENAWQHIASDQPRYGKYQEKSDREYPVVRLTPR
ncbi:nitroreductase family deazaflavin-dependent oxidoreductase [Nocardia pseudobrasiliensis]|uniref:Deazaflavin-dependent oxidoreductase (Nitroreductase family) n=1 Tax=Nocardia pseudobrasiliensis TaxID=45979 RepID=A0A370IFK7_9NOCA|nr:nitroreductase family deazaflavin-dependent oxidoreductase [Nocardia pseudobrasiliensis]RDI69487.1 deazaflavin-dependent oxidoreductase (nitroreductase family) [Nocardia pseudobrasiliensis]